MLGSQAFDSFSRPDTKDVRATTKGEEVARYLDRGGEGKNTFPGITPDFEPQEAEAQYRSSPR